MTPDKLASQELAKWRENENKHKLKMIKKTELDLLSCAKSYVLKTHKGKEVMEGRETDMIDIDKNISVADVVTALNNSAVSSTNQFLDSNAAHQQSAAEREIAYVKSYQHQASTSSNLSTSSSSKKKKDKVESHRSRSRESDHHGHDKSNSSSSSKHKASRKRSRVSVMNTKRVMTGGKTRSTTVVGRRRRSIIIKRRVLRRLCEAAPAVVIIKVESKKSRRPRLSSWRNRNKRIII
jgi:hypothetical protein